MQYLSPATFFGETLSTPLDKKAIQLGRKKLFAELELGGGSTIDLHGKAFTKNDIINYFEDLLKEEALSYHNAVGTDRVLLAFLENGRIGRKEMFQNNPLFEDQQFIAWVSPYFSASFLAFMNACFEKPDEDGLMSLMKNKLLMTPADLERCWEAVTRIVMDDLATLQRYRAQSILSNSPGDVSLSQARDLMEFRYIRIIQLLPQARFASLRDRYALSMQNVCIDIFNKLVQFRSNVRTFMENAKLLAVSQEVKNQIGNKLEEMEVIMAPQEEVEDQKVDDSKSSSPIKIIIFILLVVIKIATCNSCAPGSSSSSSYLRPVDVSMETIYQESPSSTSKGSEATVEPPIPVFTGDTVTFTHKVRRRSKHK